MWNYYGEHMWGGGIFGGLMMLLVWGGIIFFLVWLIREITECGSKEKSPLNIVKERYAKGEIDTKEFEEKKKKLE